jgi:hypothetical protein
MESWVSSSSAERIVYSVFLLAASLCLWIGGSFLISPHLDEASLPRRALRRGVRAR